MILLEMIPQSNSFQFKLLPVCFTPLVDITLGAFIYGWLNVAVLKYSFVVRDARYGSNFLH